MTARFESQASQQPNSCIRSIGKKEFALFQRLIQRESGIFLPEHKSALLAGRLSKRLRALSLNSFRAYYDCLFAPGNAEELARMIDCICTNETRFFRQPGHWEFLKKRVYPEWRAAAGRGARPRRIRAWSAACSTGEEPYTLAMTLLEQFPPESRWQIEVQATDLSTRVLAQAREGIWRLEKSRDIPAPFLQAFMLRGVGAQEGLMKAGPAIRSVLHFRRLNLNAEVYAVQGAFDLIFCRNVLIYFDAPTKQKVLDRLLRHLAKDGYLFLGNSESMPALQARASRVGPAILAPNFAALPATGPFSEASAAGAAAHF